MNRKIIFTPAWDKTNPDPTKNYGVKDLGILFVVYEENKFVSFEISTNWYLPHVMDRRVEGIKKDVWLGKEDFLLRTWISPYPMDVFYISPKPINTEDDHLWENGFWVFGINIPCYYGYRYQKEEGEIWTTDYLYWKLIKEGDESVWEWLENWYKELFGDEN